MTSKEAILLRSGLVVLLGMVAKLLGRFPPLCSFENRLMASNCSSGALSGI